MRYVNLLAELVVENCTGCTICEKVCPTLAMKMVPYGKPKFIVEIDKEKCVGCWACEQRCPFDALKMVRHPAPYTVGVSTEDVDPAAIQALCDKAHLHPEQVVCYCTATRAEEVAAAVLKGKHTAEQLSYHTGIRTGCKVECAQPILRMLEAAGKPHKNTLKDGWQLYGRTATAWDLPAAVKAKHGKRGFFFAQDQQLLDDILATGKAPAKSGDD